MALVVLVPELDAALALFANSTAGGDVVTKVRDRVLALLGVPAAPDPTRQPDLTTDLESVCGTYRRYGTDVQLSAREDLLVLRSTSSQPIVQRYLSGQALVVPVQLLEGGALGVGRGSGVPVAHLVDDYVYSGLRLAARA